jgi:pectin methylesterase-like acyl-CoA thioesterase
MAIFSLPPIMSLKPAHVASFATILVLALSLSGHVDGLTAQTVIDSPLLTHKIGTNRTIKVDINGDGDFTSVQEAINAVPKNNSQWIIIHLRKGVYR